MVGKHLQKVGKRDGGVKRLSGDKKMQLFKHTHTHVSHLSSPTPFSTSNFLAFFSYFCNAICLGCSLGVLGDLI